MRNLLRLSASKAHMGGTEIKNPQTGSCCTDHRWAIVLAGGDGTRLQALTSRRGTAVPKQFCSLRGGPSLLRQALTRASAVAPLERVLVVVAENHRRWWERELSHVPPANIIVQPGNRGTAAGILLPLLHLLDRDPEGRVLIVPSDHFVASEKTLVEAARRALERTTARNRIVLLGISPDEPEPGFGWIVPGRRRAEGLAEVAQFVEKPDRGIAAGLMRRGALWNSFLLAAKAEHLVERYRQSLPDLATALENHSVAPAGRKPCRRLRLTYKRLPVFDFSRDLLESSSDSLEVLTVPGCGWSDLGTPERVASCLRQASSRILRRQMSTPPIAALDLSVAHQRFATGP